MEQDSPSQVSFSHGWQARAGLLARGLWPALLALLFASLLGTLPGAAQARWDSLGLILLLVAAGGAGTAWRDPLGLGGWRWLMPLFALALLLSWLASPVARAGRDAMLMLPLLILLPAAVARAWNETRARQWGLLALRLGYGAIAVWALVAWQVEGTDGASRPLGHHGPLAAWLLTLLPIVLLGAREAGPSRSISLVSSCLGIAALLASRSLAGALTLLFLAPAALTILLARGENKARWRWKAIWLMVLAVVLGMQGSRLLDLGAGADSSLLARRTYFNAGLEAVQQRPLLGWGPGASAWTLGEHLQPQPGVNPPGQVVTQLHNLPLGIAYELGLLGLLLAIALVLALVRSWRRGRGSEGWPLCRAALLGLAGLLLACLAGFNPGITALPVTAAVVAGAGLAGLGLGRRTTGSPLPLVVAGAIGLMLLPSQRAQHAYDRAVMAQDAEDSLRWLRRAEALDPSWPLYRARRSWLQAELEGVSPSLAEQALGAAHEARSLAPLYLAAGTLGRSAGLSWDRGALRRACDLDPLGAMAPFLLAVDDPYLPDAATAMARALLSEPRLLAAEGYAHRYGLLRAAADLIVGQESLELGWRAALDEAVWQAVEEVGAHGHGGRAEAGQRLAVGMDLDPATSLSLHAFRRRPWPVYVAEVELQGGRLPSPEVPGAVHLRSTGRELFEWECSMPGAQGASPKGTR